MVVSLSAPAVGRPSKMRLALAQHDREGHQHQPVDQPGGEQRQVERAAALDQQVAAFALLQLGDRGGRVARQFVAVVPVQRLSPNESAHIC